MKKKNKELEQAAEEYAQSLSKGAMTGKEYCKQDFKAGAEWQKRQDELTWKDAQRLYNTCAQCLQIAATSSSESWMGWTQGIFTEALRRYNEQAKKEDEE